MHLRVVTGRDFQLNLTQTHQFPPESICETWVPIDNGVREATKAEYVVVKITGNICRTFH